MPNKLIGIDIAIRNRRNFAEMLIGGNEVTIWEEQLPYMPPTNAGHVITANDIFADDLLPPCKLFYSAQDLHDGNLEFMWFRPNGSYWIYADELDKDGKPILLEKFIS